MKKSNIFFKKKTITIALGIISSLGVIATAVSVAKATPKAIELMKEAEEEKGEELTKAEKLKTIAPAYIFPTVIGASTIALIVSSSILSLRYQKSLASMYGLLGASYAKYKDEVIKRYGTDVHKDIQKTISIEKTKDVYPCSPGLKYCANTDFDEEGDICLFYDAYSDRYFESTVAKVLLAQLHLNRNYALRGSYATLNEYYEFLGLDLIDGGDLVGWASIDDLQWIDFINYKTPLEDIPFEGSNNYLECYVSEFQFPPTAEALEEIM